MYSTERKGMARIDVFGANLRHTQIMHLIVKIRHVQGI